MFIIVGDLVLRKDVIIAVERCKEESAILITTADGGVYTVEDTDGTVWEYLLTMLPCEKSYSDFVDAIRELLL